MTKKLFTLVVAVAVVIGLSGYKQVFAKSSGGTIKIGVLLELTGGLAPMGDEMKNALAASFDVLGKTIDGKHVKIIIQDTGSSSTGTLDKARLLVETDKVAMLWGPVDAGCRLALAAYLMRVHVPDMAIAGDVNEAILKYNKWAWTYGTQHQVTYPSGIYAYQHGYRTATVIGSDISAGRQMVKGFEVAFEKMGGKIVQEQWVPFGTKDFTPYIVNMKKADVIASWVGDADGLAFFPQLKKSGNKMPIVQVEHGGLILSPAAAPEFGNSIVGIVTTTRYLNTMNTYQNKEFVKAYKARYHMLPGPFAGMMFGTVQATYDALKRTHGNTNPAKLAKALSEPAKTVCGLIRWDSRHDAIMPVHVVRINAQDKPVLIKSYVTTAVKEGNTLVTKIVK